MVSRLLRATPPSIPPDGDGRIKAFSQRDRFSILVLSPRMLPPVTVLDGSTASTATFLPKSLQSIVPKASMNVDLPAPGTPVMPIRNDFPLCGKRDANSSCAFSK